MCSFELVDSDDKTVDMFVFPVMPEQMSERIMDITNIKKTNSGVSVVKTPSFVPTEISIRGNFGRKFKFLIGNKRVDTSVLAYSVQSGNYMNYFGEMNIRNKPFSNTIKTGYGAFKVLQAILHKSKLPDRKNNPMKLYFYNPALGNSYLVSNPELTQQQTQESNMIWNYSLSFKSIAPIAVRSVQNNKSSLTRIMTFDNMNKLGNTLASQLKFELKRALQ